MKKPFVTKPRLIGVAVAIVVVAAAVYIMRPTPIAVDTAVVGRHAMEATVEADGRTRVRDRYTVVAPVAGRLERMTSTEGSLVRAGDIVARLAPVPLDSEAFMLVRARVDAANALALEATGQARIARAELEQRRRELSRATRLAEAGGVSPRQVEEAQLAVVQAEEAARGADERVKATQADSRQANAALSARDAARGGAVLVRSPANGRVLRVPERSERIVAAGTPIIEIGDPATLEIVIDVLSSDAATIHQGDQVRFADWGGASDGERSPSLSGRVRDVEPAGFTKVSALGVDEQRVNVIADISAAPPTVGDGFRVEASIVVWRAQDVIALPRSALLQPARGAHTGGTWNVFIVRDGRVETRSVRVGHVGGADAEILAGVNAGEEVVLFPSDRIAAGVRVRGRKI